MKGLRKKVTSILLAATLSFGMLSGTGLNAYADEISTEEIIEQQDVETATAGSAEEIPEEATTSEELVEATDETVEEATEEPEEDITSEEAEESAEEVETEEAVSPAFSDEAIIDGVTIKVSAPEGVFSEGAYLSVSSVSESEKTFAEDAVSAKRAADTNVADSYTFDIKVLDSDGNELQPEDGNLVKVSFSMDEVSNENLDAIIYHIPDDGIADQLYTNVEGDTASAMSDGFSLYTVEFSYGSLEYVMEGDSSVALSDILSHVGLLGEITAAQSSAPELFSVTDEGGIWTVKALQAFSTEETLTVTIDGVTYEIKVTDDQSYSIWIGNTRVTDSNKADILGDGTVSYDSDSKILTFNGFNYSDTMGVNAQYAGVNSVIAILESGTTVKGSAKIVAPTNCAGITMGEANVTFEDADLDVESTYGALYYGSDVEIKSGAYRFDSDSNSGISYFKKLTISGGDVYAIGSTHGIYSYSYTLTVTGGSVTAVSRDSSIYSYDAIGVDTLNISGGRLEAYGKNGEKAFGIHGTLNIAPNMTYVKNEMTHKIITAKVDNAKVTVTTDGNGIASATPASGATGTEVTLSATPNSGYKFKEWQLASGSAILDDVNSSTTKFNIESTDVTLKAIFEEDSSYPVWLGHIKVTSENKDNILDEVDADGNPTATFDPDTNTLTFNDSNPNIPLTNGESSVTAKGIDLTINAPHGVTLINPYLGSGISLNSVNSLTLNGDFTIKDGGTQTEKEIYSGGDIIINGKIIAGSVCSEKGNITINDDVTLDSIAEGIYAKEGAVSITGNSDIYSYSQGIKAKDEVSVTGDVTIQNKKYDGIFSEGSIVLDGKVNILTQDENGCGIKSEDGNINITGNTDIEAGYNGIFVMDESETGDKAIILSGENNKVVSNNWTAVSSGAFIITTGNITATGNNCAIAGYCGVDITGNVEASSKNFEAISSANGSVIIDGDVTAKTDSSINGAIYAKNDVELKSGKWVLDGSSSSGAVNAGNKIIIADTHEIKEPEGAKLSTEGRNILNADSTRAAHVVLGRKKGVITFDLNGGLLDGQPTFTVEAEVGDTITIPTSIPVRDGYSFSYWKGSEYYPGDSYTITGDHTLTAQWEEDASIGKTVNTGNTGNSSGTNNTVDTNNTVTTDNTTNTNNTVNTNGTVTTDNTTNTNNTVNTDKSVTTEKNDTNKLTKTDDSSNTSSGNSDTKAPAATVTTGDSTPGSSKNLTTNQKSGPATGDNTSMFLLLSLMAISLLGMITIVKSKKSKAE